MDREKFFDRFQLDDYLAFDDQVQLISGFKPDSLVRDRKGDLPLKLDEPDLKFAAETGFIG